MVVDYVQIGKKIAKRRKALGLKQYEVCEMADLNPKYLSCIETARSTPSLDALLRVLKVLDMRPDEVFTDAEGISLFVGEDTHAGENYHTSDTNALVRRYTDLSPKSREMVDSFIEWLKDKENIENSASNEKEIKFSV